MKFLGCLSGAALAALFTAPSCCSFQASSQSKWAIAARGQKNSFESMRLASTSPKAKRPGSAELDTPWEELGFEFRPTNSHIRITHKDGEWQTPELVKVSGPMHSPISVLNMCVHSASSQFVLMSFCKSPT